MAPAASDKILNRIRPTTLSRGQRVVSTATRRFCLLCLGLVIFLGAGASARSQFYEFTFPGASSVDGWDQLTIPRLSGYGGFPGSSSWPAPIVANVAGSGDASLSRLAGAPGGGGPFPAVESLYFGSLLQVTNALGGTLRVSDGTPVAGVRTVVFQIQIGEAVGYDFQLPSGRPMLKVNGATNGVTPAVSVVLNRYQSGSFFSPETLQEEPIYVNTWGFEWHLPAEPAVTSLAIDFSAVTHAQIYRMQLNQTATVASGVFLPELAMGARGTPFFDGSVTTVTNAFHATPGALLQVDYRGDLGGGPWIGAGLHSVDNEGQLTVSFTASGDRRAEWSRRMFFRAYHPSNP
jgi:hypothetical protein